jgi:hypothetical protein
MTKDSKQSTGSIVFAACGAVAGIAILRVLGIGGMIGGAIGGGLGALAGTLIYQLLFARRREAP